MVVQLVYVDRCFTFAEYQAIYSATMEWQYVTRGLVSFRLVYPSEVDELSLDRNVVLRVTSHHPYVEMTEVQYVRDGNKNKIAGFWSLWNGASQHWRMSLVMDRLHDLARLRIVAIHEFGHSLRLDHQDLKLGIMNAATNMQNTACLNASDMKQFSTVYGRDMGLINYCDGE